MYVYWIVARCSNNDGGKIQSIPIDMCTHTALFSCWWYNTTYAYPAPPPPPLPSIQIIFASNSYNSLHRTFSLFSCVAVCIGKFYSHVSWQSAAKQPCELCFPLVVQCNTVGPQLAKAKFIFSFKIIFLSSYS